MNESTEWVSLGEAARILGVHPATVRNWADRGELPFRRTPGGHRRFRRPDLVQWAAAQHATQPAEAQLIVQSALGRILLEIDDEPLGEDGPRVRIDPVTREILRAQVRPLMNALMAELTTVPSHGNGAPATPSSVGVDFATAVQERGLSLREAVRGFAYFRQFVIDSVIQLSETGSPRSPSEWGEMLRKVHNFADETLLAIVEFYQQGSVSAMPS